MVGTNNCNNYQSAQYNVIVGGSSNTIANIPPSSTVGYPYVSNGLSANPSFQQGPSTNLFLLDSQTTLYKFTTGITSTFNTYLLTFSHLFPAVNSNQFDVEFSTDGGATYLLAGYQSGSVSWNNYNSATISVVNTSTHSIHISDQDSGGTIGYNGYLYIFNATSGGYISTIGQSSNRGVATPNTGFQINGGTTTITNINALRVVAGGNTVASGKITLYGVLE